MNSPFSRCWAEIKTQALADNIGALNSLGSAVMAVVKADAYGHGVELIAPLLVAKGIRHFGVATVAEGQQLRKLTKDNCPDAAIYIMAAILPEEAPAVVASRLIPFVSDFALAQALSAAAKNDGRGAEIHLEVDTGIGRAGVSPADTPHLLAACENLPTLRVTGICTHFTAADSADPADCAAQYALFEKVLASLPPGRLARMTVHAANSPAALRLPAARRQLIRPGLLLYGIAPSRELFAGDGFAYHPVLSLKARTLLVRRLPAGTDISYSRTYRLPREATIATIGIGYGDGFPRRLSNQGHVLLPSGERAPIRGRVCMDQICVELPEGSALAVGDTVTLIGRVGDEQILVTDMADQIDTTPHEITTCLTPRVPRVLVNG